MKSICFFYISISCCFLSRAQTIYFPPVNNNLPWDTLSASSMGWCTDRIDSLYDFLQQENTKGFILLKDGKIVLEKYFGSFTKDSIWYWASAGKTITSFLTGKAQEEGYLSLTDSTSKFLGAGWTSCSASQEANIKIVHQLTMTTGLDDGVADNHCTIDSCLIYLSDPGTRWAYHNAPYTLLESVLTNATGTQINPYTQSRLKDYTGMNGIWLTIDFDNVYFSNARSMARFGLLIQNKCIWNTDTLMHDTVYINQMTNTSQNLNYSYGYLWWLNGKQSYMVPTLQTVFPGSYAPNAPADMYSALGKNGQILSIAPSEGLIYIRIGDSPNSPASEITTLFCDQIWQKINDIVCTTASTIELNSYESIVKVFPNPTNGKITIELPGEVFQLSIFDITGSLVIFSENNFSKWTPDLSLLAPGTYTAQIKRENGQYLIRKILIGY